MYAYLLVKESGLVTFQFVSLSHMAAATSPFSLPISSHLTSQHLHRNHSPGSDCSFASQDFHSSWANIVWGYVELKLFAITCSQIHNHSAGFECILWIWSLKASLFPLWIWVSAFTLQAVTGEILILPLVQGRTQAKNILPKVCSTNFSNLTDSSKVIVKVLGIQQNTDFYNITVCKVFFFKKKKQRKGIGNAHPPQSWGTVVLALKTSVVAFLVFSGIPSFNSFCWKEYYQCHADPDPSPVIPNKMPDIWPSGIIIVSVHKS